MQVSAKRTLHGLVPALLTEVNGMNGNMKQLTFGVCVALLVLGAFVGAASAAAWYVDDECGTTAYIRDAVNIGETINFYNESYKEDVNVGYVPLISNNMEILYSHSSEPTNTILNIEVLDENRNPKPNLDVDLKYFASEKTGPS